MSADAQLQRSRLRALIERAAPADTSQSTPGSDSAEHCGLCGVPIPEQHRHVLDLERRELRCACRPCSILFDQSAAGGHRYRLIPERRVTLDGIKIDDLCWRALEIPVQMAFFVRDGKTDRVRAFYPSPSGATESQLPLDAWEELEDSNPALAQIEPDTEALLVNRIGGCTRAFIVGVDQCYRLVAVVRTHWRGFTGGDGVWRETEAFFQQLDAAAETRE